MLIHYIDTNVSAVSRLFSQLQPIPRDFTFCANMLKPNSRTNNISLTTANRPLSRVTLLPAFLFGGPQFPRLP